MLIHDHQYKLIYYIPKNHLNNLDVLPKSIAILRGEYLELSAEIIDNVQDLVGNAEYLTNMGCGLHGLVDTIWKVHCNSVQCTAVHCSFRISNTLQYTGV